MRYFLEELGLQHEQRARLEQKDMGHWDALMWSCYAPDEQSEFVDLLLKHGAQGDSRVSYQMTALLWASGRGHTQAVRTLLRYTSTNSIDIYHNDRFGSSALYRKVEMTPRLNK